MTIIRGQDGSPYEDFPSNNTFGTPTVTMTAGEECKHENGWYGTVRFCWIFYRRIFACSDCGEMLYGKEYKKHKRRFLEA